MAKRPGIEIRRHDPSAETETYGSLDSARSWQWERLAVSSSEATKSPPVKQQEIPSESLSLSVDNLRTYEPKKKSFTILKERLPERMQFSSENSGRPDSILHHLRHSSLQRQPRRPSRSTSTAAMLLTQRASSSKSLDRDMDEGFELGEPGSRFRLGRTIGAGGSSVVFEACAMDDDNKQVAVKVIYPNSACKGLKHEATIWKQLPRHPHLLSLLYHEKRPVSDSNDGKHREYFVMEYSHYGNLLQLVRNEGQSTVMPNPRGQEKDDAAPASSSSRHSSLNLPRCRGIPLYQARSIMRQLASALHCLHTVAHVVHNDLKLENILGFPSQEDDTGILWKVADFGLAEFVASDETAHLPPTPCGTMEYISPEMVRFLDPDMEIFDKIPSHAKPSPPPDLSPYARDMWALGCIFYVLCAGSLPFKDGIQSRLLERISDSNYELPYRLLSDTERENLPAESLNEDPQDTNESREQAREVLVHLLDVDPYTRWDIERLCHSRWLAM